MTLVHVFVSNLMFKLLRSMYYILLQCYVYVISLFTWCSTHRFEKPTGNSHRGIRFDFFVGRSSESGKAIVRTLEICELGFSMLGKKDPNGDPPLFFGVGLELVGDVGDVGDVGGCSRC